MLGGSAACKASPSEDSCANQLGLTFVWMEWLSFDGGCRGGCDGLNAGWSRLMGVFDTLETSVRVGPMGRSR